MPSQQNKRELSSKEIDLQLKHYLPATENKFFKVVKNYFYKHANGIKSKQQTMNLILLNFVTEYFSVLAVGKENKRNHNKC